jgi:osmotically-inducible protein OsmY
MSGWSVKEYADVIVRPFGPAVTSAFFRLLAKTGFAMRTDKQLKADVIEELMWEPTVTSKNITIEAKDGVVTLSGTVPTYAEKWSAERATQRVEGVKAIAEELEVSPAGSHKRNDPEIAAAAVNALRWHVWVPAHIQAKVEDGWVTLTGSVKWGYERTAAEDAVSFLPGVKGVANDITLKPSVQPTAIKDAITNALKRDAEIDAENIDVSTDGGKVTLAGSVSSWDEREEAAATAWNAPGVDEVANDLVVLD